MTNDTDSFVQEVNESLREDRALTLLKRYGPYILGGFAALLVGLIAWQWWQSYSVQQAQAQAEEYATAQQSARSGNFDAAKTEFERLSSEGPSVYRAMAQAEHAAVLEAQGDLEGALREFDAAAERARDPLLKETMQLRAAYIAAESQDFEAVRERLQPLVDSESRLSFLARELLAIEAWEAGQNDIARDTLENLTLAFDAPDGVRQRAQVALSVIGPAPAATEAPAPAEGESK